ncbi:hypothetical protein [Rhodococcus sp. NPDC058521]|uniref:hypothetical protein n=1 Tax=Rhodococcus sp. NPDC058521 TaxID=3346536 RepID=UPI003647C626
MSSNDRTGLDRFLAPNVLPSHLFGGRVRTSTLFLVILWLVLYSLNAYLNPEEPEPSVVTNPPAATSEAPVETPAPQTTTSVTSETTTEPTTTTESTTTESTTTEQTTSESTTTAPGLPLFEIPGLNRDTPAPEDEPTTMVPAVPAP